MLIVPGFMSSGLEVRKSPLKPEWQGQRIWMSLSKLGFASMHSEGVFESFVPVYSQPPQQQGLRELEVTPLAEERGADLMDRFAGADCSNSQQEQLTQQAVFQRHLKNRWLEHLILQSPHQEAPGMEVRAVEGMDGIDFLDKGAISHFTYVFGPVLKALHKAEYKEGVNMEAASYDWRLSPCVLHRRDNHFEDMAVRIERLDRGAGVVVLGHSMGNKVVQYFLAYMKQTRGQAWLDRYVYSWVACGAPTLGACKALRTTLTGDCMGLESFLSLNEAITMARSFSSSPWLFPLGLHADSPVYLRRQGILEVRCVSGEFKHVTLRATSDVELSVQVKWGSYVEDLRTGNSTTFDGQTALFKDTAVLQFGGPAVLPTGASLQILIKENKSAVEIFGREFSVCCCFWALLLFPVTFLIYCCRVCRGALHVANIMDEWRAGRGTGILRGYTGSLLLAHLEQSRGRWVCYDLPMPKQAWCCCCRCCGCCWRTPGSVRVELRWRNAEDVRAECGLPAVVTAQQVMDAVGVPVRHAMRPHEVYDRVSLSDILRLEGCAGVEKTWEEHFVGDPLYDHIGQNDCPPVKRVVAVNGVNVPTEVALVLCVNRKRLDSKSDLLCRYGLDSEAALVPSTDLARRCSIKGGVVLEEPRRGSEKEAWPTGDGTVPAVSLFRAREWKDQLQYREINLDGAGHREMLADARFHDAVIKALTVNSSAFG